MYRIGRYERAYNDVPSQDLVIFRYLCVRAGTKMKMNKRRREISKSASSHSFVACSNSFERKERKDNNVSRREQKKKCRLFTSTASLNVDAMWAWRCVCVHDHRTICSRLVWLCICEHQIFKMKNRPICDSVKSSKAAVLIA